MIDFTNCVEEIMSLKEQEIKNITINCYSCLKENGKKINYMSYIKSMNNIDCNNAIKRVFNNIKIDEINRFIDSIDCISKIRKEFYKNIINQRYNIIKSIYEELV